MILGFVLIGGASQLLLGIASGDCSDQGPVDAGCGSGENGCAGSNQANCEADDAKDLSTGLFACGDVGCRTSCRNSAEEKDACYSEYDCIWKPNETPKCKMDLDSQDVHNDWIKTSDACVAEGCP